MVLSCARVMKEIDFLLSCRAEDEEMDVAVVKLGQGPGYLHQALT